MKSCINCQTLLQGPFCHACGQKAQIPRITVKNTIHKLFESITNVEKGFWHTFLRLFSKPAEVIKGFIGGNTKRYYNPIRYFLIWVGLSTLIMITLGVYDNQTSSMNDLMGISDDPEQLKRQLALQKQIKKFLNFIPLFQIPFLSLISFWLFRKHGFNYAEHLTKYCYLFAQVSIIGIPLTLTYYFVPSLVPFAVLIGLSLSAIYFAYVFKPLYQLNWLPAIGSGLLVSFGGMLFMFLSISIIGILLVIILALASRLFF